MDTEALKTLGSLLLWGGLFYLMMRFGCGAHMMGGHGDHGGHGKDGGSSGNKDPVCGMAVASDKAAGASVHAGNTYYFCSTSCRDKFEQAPGKYIGASTPAQGGHHHG